MTLLNYLREIAGRRPKKPALRPLVDRETDAGSRRRDHLVRGRPCHDAEAMFF